MNISINVLEEMKTSKCPHCGSNFIFNSYGIDTVYDVGYVLSCPVCRQEVKTLYCDPLTTKKSNFFDSFDTIEIVVHKK